MIFNGITKLAESEGFEPLRNRLIAMRMFISDALGTVGNTAGHSAKQGPL
jgi:hypothetical protein